MMLLHSGGGVTESPLAPEKQCVSLEPCSPEWFLAGRCGHGELVDFMWAACVGSREHVGGEHEQRNGLSHGKEGKEVAGSCANGLSCQYFSWESPTAHSKTLVVVQGDIFSCDGCS